MSLVESNMMNLGTIAPDFSLLDTISKRKYNVEDLKKENGLVVIFTCNHCPYVIHVNSELIAIANEYKLKGIGFVAISSNDIENYPLDSPDKMEIVGMVLKFPFPYLYDESQDVAKSYDAACTPDIFVFDKDKKLYYRGRLDGSRPGNNIPLTGGDLKNALDSMINGNHAPEKQYPSAGCNIKWKK
ncbi:MAG: thioredoxin family protein [Saprospiraceae bacterium]